MTTANDMGGSPMATTPAPLVLEIPVLAAGRNAFQEYIYEIALNPRWDDDDERWDLLTCAYNLIESNRERRWDERYHEALEALLVLVDILPLAFNVDGCTPDQLDQFRAAKRASDTIAANLDRVMTGV